MNSEQQQLLSRRRILKSTAGCGMMSSVSVMSTLLNLQATKAMAAGSGPTDYKAIVCVFLLGGNDSFNMLVPRSHGGSSAEYDAYVSARSGLYNASTNSGGLALAESSLLAVADPLNDLSRSFGLHPGLGTSVTGNLGTNGGIAKLFNDGNLAFVANVGSLLQPTSRTGFNNASIRPLGLFSHSDLQRHWMTAAPDTRSKVTGWGGRMADLFKSTNLNTSVSASFSLSGSNLFQTGGLVFPYAIETTGATAVTKYVQGSGDVQTRMFVNSFDSVLGQTYSNLLAQSFADAHRGAANAAVEFNTAVGNVSLNTTFHPSDGFGKQMEMIAKTIAVAPQLQQTRQIFFVVLDDWDHHSGLVPKQAAKFPVLSRGLKSFYDATVELGCQNDVVTFTASDFARTLSSNGQGSDHAWGGNQLIMGGGVQGKRIFGSYPTSLSTPLHDFSSLGDGSAENLSLGRGRLIPTTSVDELAAELAIWFGVNNATDLQDILPNIENFYQYSASTKPLGILA